MASSDKSGGGGSSISARMYEVHNDDHVKPTSELERGALELLALSNLAQTFVAQQKYDEAEPLLREAISTSVAVLGPMHNDTLHAYSNLAQFLVAFRVGKHEEASKLYMRELEGSLKSRGRTHALTIMCTARLADVLIKHEHYAAAEPLVRDHVEVTRAVYGPLHHETHAAVLKLIKLMQEKGQVEEAEKLARDELEVCSSVQGREHARAMKTLLAGLLRSQGREVDGELVVQPTAKNRRAQHSRSQPTRSMPAGGEPDGGSPNGQHGPVNDASIREDKSIGTGEDEIVDANEKPSQDPPRRWPSFCVAIRDCIAQPGGVSKAQARAIDLQVESTSGEQRSKHAEEDPRHFLSVIKDCLAPQSRNDLPSRRAPEEGHEGSQEISEERVHAVLGMGRPAVEVRTPERNQHGSTVSAICFVAGHLDLLSAVALSCVDSGTHRILSKWLKGLRSVHVRTTEKASRLNAVAVVASRLPHLVEIFVGSYRLDVRWLRNADAQAKQVLDLASTTVGARGSPLAAFQMCFIACRMASAKRTGVRRVVPAKACEIDLHARKLDLKAKELGDIGSAALLGAISGGNTPNLRELVLTQNKLTDAVMEPLAAAIASGGLEGLKGLSLAENKIGASGIARLVVSLVGRDALAELSELPELHKLSQEAASAIEGGRRSRLLNPERDGAHDGGLTSLTSLVLDGNQLGDDGVGSLAAPLACGSFPALEYLGLSRNNITDPSPIERAIAAGELPMLRRLLLQQNPLKNGATQAIHDTVAASTPKPMNSLASARGGQCHQPPTGVAVRVRKSFQPISEPKAKYTPAHRRGLSPTGANQRDASAQTRFHASMAELHA